MTCKDCICSDVCYYKSFNDVRALKKRRDDVEKICKSFVHRDSVKVVEIDQIKNAPTVDAVEVVHGRWVQCQDWDYDYECSVCECHAGEDIGGNYSKLTPYCPNCGAKMMED